MAGGLPPPGLSMWQLDGSVERLGWQDLWTRAAGVEPLLRAAGVGTGSVVLVLGPPSLDLFAAVEAVWACGAAVHQQAFWIREDEGHLASATAKKVRTLGATVAVLGDVPAVVRDAVQTLDGVTVLDVARAGAAAPSAAPPALVPALAPPDPPDDQVAIVQASSGTTGSPRLLHITWGMIRANVRAIVPGFGLGEVGPERFGSWLPLFHDMGMIGFYVVPRLLGAAATLLPTASFVASPLSWVQLLTEDRTTVSGLRRRRSPWWPGTSSARH